MKKHIRSYQVLEEVAAGGHATVHRVFDERTKQSLALKVLHPHLSRDPEYLSRFQREANLASLVDNRNVVRIFEVGKEAGAHFIAMEFVPITLEQVLQRGALSVPWAVDIARQVACGLEAARRYGIIHRDIKPQNILLDEEGTVKITDFGIARLLDVSTMSHQSLVMGTPQYMAPEQARGSGPDTRADMYSLGIILYQMLTGKLPFSADNPWEVIRQHVEESPRPMDEVCATVPAVVSDVVDRCLAKEPEARFQTPQQLADVLGGLQPSVGLPSSSDVAWALEETLIRNGLASGPITLPLPERSRFRVRFRKDFRVMVFVAVPTVLLAIVVAGVFGLPGLFTASPMVLGTSTPMVPSITPGPLLVQPVPAQASTGNILEVTKDLPFIGQGESASAIWTGVQAAQLGVLEVGIEAKEDLPSSVVRVRKFAGPPTQGIPPGNVYSYFQITLTGAPAAGVEKGSVRFFVPRSWLAAEGTGAGDISMYAYEGDWVRLEAVQQGQSPEAVVYVADWKSLGYFAIVSDNRQQFIPTPTPSAVDVLVMEQSVVGDGSTSVFMVAAAPWKLQYRTGWSGELLLSARTPSKNVELARHDVISGLLYETYVHGLQGALSLAVSGGSPDQEWTIWVTSNPSNPGIVPFPGVTLSYTGTSQASTPLFEVSSSPWLLRFETTWTGRFTLSAHGAEGRAVVFDGEVAEGVSYETYVYGVTGTVYLASQGAPANGRWLVRVNDDPKVQKPPLPALLTYTGTGRTSTPPFTVEHSPWRLVYMATWTGRFTLVGVTEAGPDVLVEREVVAGVIYETVVERVKGGRVHLSVEAAPPDRPWSISLWVEGQESGET